MFTLPPWNRYWCVLHYAGTKWHRGPPLIIVIVLILVEIIDHGVITILRLQRWQRLNPRRIIALVSANHPPGAKGQCGSFSATKVGEEQIKKSAMLLSLHRLKTWQVSDDNAEDDDDESKDESGSCVVIGCQHPSAAGFTCIWWSAMHKYHK